MKNTDFPEENNNNRTLRAILQLGGIIPIAGSFLSATAGIWSEKDQEKINQFLKYWLKTLEDELKEKHRTILEIMNRIDLQDKKISERLESKEYLALANKAFRDWNVAESEEKRKYIRNILTNAASSSISTDDVVRLFIEWISKYSEFHFQVIAAIYNNNGITRYGVWHKIRSITAREDSADADLYKLLFRDLSTGGIIRQHRQKDYYGNFIKKTKSSAKSYSNQASSAFDDNDEYELTELGQQFVHYAMTDLPIRIEY